MVYLAIKDGGVVHHTSREALRKMDGIEKSDLEIPDEEFEAARCLARIIGGKIFLGQTDEEKIIENNQQEIRALKLKLNETDYIATK